MGIGLGIALGGIKDARDQARLETIQDEKLAREQARHGLDMEKGEFALGEARQQSERDQYRFGIEQEQDQYTREEIRPHEEWKRGQEKTEAGQQSKLYELQLRGAQRADEIGKIQHQTKKAIAQAQDKTAAQQVAAEGVRKLNELHTAHLGDIYKAFNLQGGKSAARLLNEWPMYTSEDVADVVEKDGQIMAVDAEGNVIEDPTFGPMVLDREKAAATWGAKEEWSYKDGVKIEKHSGKTEEVSGGGGGLTPYQQVQHARNISNDIRRIAATNEGALNGDFISLDGIRKENAAVNGFAMERLMDAELVGDTNTANFTVQRYRLALQAYYENEKGLKEDEATRAVNETVAQASATQIFEGGQHGVQQSAGGQGGMQQPAGVQPGAAPGAARAPIPIMDMTDPKMATLQVGDTFVFPDGRQGRVTPAIYEAIQKAVGGQAPAGEPTAAQGGAPATSAAPAAPAAPGATPGVQPPQSESALQRHFESLPTHNLLGRMFGGDEETQEAGVKPVQQVRRDFTKKFNALRDASKSRKPEVREKASAEFEKWYSQNAQSLTPKQRERARKLMKDM